MTIAELRTYVNATFTPNGSGGIDGSELQAALLEICNRLEAAGAWVPLFVPVVNGANVVLKIVDWSGGQGTKPAIGVYLTSTGYSFDVNAGVNIKGAQGAQGLPGNGLLTVTTSTADGLNATRYYPVALIGTGGADFAQIELIVKPLGSTEHGPIHINLYCTYRGGLKYEWTASGPLDQGIGLQLYDVSGNLGIYIKSTNNFKTLAVRVPSYSGTVYSTLTGQNTVSGTLLFDTASPNSYPPTFLTATAAESLSVYGRLKTKGITADGATPIGTASGGGLGSSGSLTVLSGVDMAFRVRLTTGTSPTANQQYGYITFGTTFPVAPRFALLSPRSQTAAKEIGKFYVRDTAVNSLSIWPNGTDVPSASTAFEFDIFLIF